jgi:hypothetical protein
MSGGNNYHHRALRLEPRFVPAANATAIKGLIGGNLFGATVYIYAGVLLFLERPFTIWSGWCGFRSDLLHSCRGGAVFVTTFCNFVVVLQFLKRPLQFGRGVAVFEATFCILVGVLRFLKRPFAIMPF